VMVQHMAMKRLCLPMLCVVSCLLYEANNLLRCRGQPLFSASACLGSETSFATSCTRVWLL
jgi:hypothetical protein